MKFEDLVQWGFIAMVVGVVAIILNEFLSITDAGTAGYTIINNTLGMMIAFTEQLPKYGKIAGVTLFIGLIAYAGFWGYQKYRGSRL